MSNGSGVFKSAKFCPACGLETLQRDTYRADNGDKSANAAIEYICLTCGLGFYLAPSKRHQHAQNLFREHREMRIGKD